MWPKMWCQQECSAWLALRSKVKKFVSSIPFLIYSSSNLLLSIKSLLFKCVIIFEKRILKRYIFARELLGCMRQPICLCDSLYDHFYQTKFKFHSRGSWEITIDETWTWRLTLLQLHLFYTKPIHGTIGTLKGECILDLASAYFNITCNV